MSSRKDKEESMGILGETKVSPSFLGSLSEGIPVPWIKSAIGAATNVIQIAEVAQSNREDREKLIDHVYALMLVVVMPLQKKTETEIPAESKANVERLSSDLTGIARELLQINRDTDPRGISGLMRSVILASKFKGQIQNCTDKLNWAMGSGQVRIYTDGILRTSRIGNGVRGIQEDTRHIHFVVRQLEGSFGNPQKVASHLSTVPPKPAIFCGRDQEIDDIANRVITDPLPRFAIRGPSGIGKTSAAVAVLEHNDIVQRFGLLRFWVRCEEVNSPGLLLDVLARALHVSSWSDDPLRDIILALSTDDQPRLLVLDNFETPLEIDGHQSDILNILSSLCGIPHLSILLTLRGALPGPELIEWSQPRLPSLSRLPLKSARDMYVAIHPQAIEDKELDILLVELGGMPLAVKLIAEIGRLGDSPTTLLELWEEERPDVGDETGASVDQSIKLSLQTKIIKSNPDALRLLSVLAFLPSGAQSALVESLIPTMSSSGHSKARVALLRTSLIFASPDDSTYLVLPPIRSFMGRHHNLTSELFEGVFQSYVNFLEQHPLDIGKPEFVENMHAVGKEERNIEAILLRALQSDVIRTPTATVIEAYLLFTLYQSRTRPRFELARAAVKAAGDQHLVKLLPATLHELGELERRQCKYDDAQEIQQKAMQEFERVGDPLSSARCLQRLGSIKVSQGRYSEALDALQKAQRESERLADPLGAARCLQSLGHLKLMEGKFDEARDAFQKAHREFESLGEPFSAARCLQCIGANERVLGSSGEAQDALQKAQRGFERLGYPLGAAQCLQSIGYIQAGQSRYDEAQDAFRKAQRGFERLGDPLGAANCLQTLGNIHARQGRYDEAQDALQKAQRGFERLGDTFGVAGCLKSLGDIEQRQGKYEEARVAFQKAQRGFEDVGHVLGLARSLRSLGHMELTQGKYDEARNTLQKAQPEFERLGDPMGVVDCLQMLRKIETAVTAKAKYNGEWPFNSTLSFPSFSLNSAKRP